MGKPGKAELAVRRQLQTPGTCGVLTKAGVPCENPAGQGTDHRGSGPCKTHERFKHVTERVPGARYSQGISENALEHFLILAEDPEITRLDDEIAVLRMRLDDINRMIEDIRARYRDKTKQQIRLGEYLHAAYGEKGDPCGTADQKALLQLTRDSAKMAESISKLVAQKNKMEEGRIVTFRQVQEVLAQVVYIIRHHVADEQLLSAIAEDFARIDVSKLEPR